MEEVRTINFRIIGYIRTPFSERKGTPIQSCYSKAEGYIEIFTEYIGGLDDLEEFSHLYLIYHFHQSKGVKLKVIPFLDKKERGVFSTRAPLRPNPIGISIVELLSINLSENILKIRGVDMLDSTPLLDIKPYVPLFDQRDAKTGWISRSLQEIQEERTSDGRF
ncbi:MAG: tRNA (N6-threonylcarbamoyladenosine(37)-N6)-methyltransferase TrmO [Candidatus Thorarchaeota archaeon]